jgi:hypothetical protein
MSEHERLVVPSLIVGGDEKLGLLWVGTHDSPGRVPPPTPLIGIQPWIRCLK